MTFQDARGVKLRADVKSEALIRRLLPEAAGLPIMGEEQGGPADLQRGDHGPLVAGGTGTRGARNG